MSKIEKLSIRGVRSFGPEGPEVINFGSPLTLIVGYNGSGKTTIIECLKYATTGELPPNSTKGGAFIHDPKLAGERNVLAQVRLSFKSTKGVKMIATRAMQVEQTKNTRKQKTLEGNLVLVKDGERTSISSRVAELDQILPQYLGVSRAILDSVIFCHQEESLWPMSEPAKLKTRFDEIFEAQKYTKAIDNLKVLRKKQVDELAKYKIIEAHAKEDKDKGERAERRSEELNNEISELRKQFEELTAQKQEAQQKSNDAYEHAATFEKIVARLEGKRIEAHAIKRSVLDLEENLKKMIDTDEELQSHLDQYEQRVADYRDENEVHRQRYSTLNQELEEHRRALGNKQSEIGKHQAQKDQHERQVRQRENLVKETSRRHNIRGFDLDVTDRQVQEFMERIAKMSRDSNSAFERARREAYEELQAAQNSLNQLNERKSSLNQSKESNRGVMNTNDKRISTLQIDLNNIRIDEGGKAALESKIEDYETRLSKARSEDSTTNWDSQIQQLNSKLRDTDERKEKLDTELFEATGKAGESARLDLLVKDQKDRQHSLKTMIGAYTDKLTTLFGRSWDPQSLDHTFQTALEFRTSACKEAENQRDGVSRELEQLKFKLKSAQESLDQKKQEVSRAESIIKEAVGDHEDINDFQTILEEREKAWDVTNSDSSAFKMKGDYFKQCLEYLDSRNACELCKRAVRPAEMGKVRDLLEKRIAKAINEMQELNEQEMADVEADYKSIKAANPSNDLWKRLKESEIPKLETEINSLNKSRDELVSRQEDADSALREKDDQRRGVESYSKTVQQIVKYQTDIGEFGRQIEELTAKQSQKGSSRGLETIKDDLKRANDESRELRAKLSQLQSDREKSRGNINTLELELRDAKSKLSTAVYELKEKRSLESQIEDLRFQNAEHRETLKSLDKDLQSLSPEIEQAQLKYNDIKQRGDDKQRELQTEASRLSDSLHQLKMVDDEIHAYIDRGGEQSLSRTRREIENLEGEVSKIEEDQRKIARDIKKIEDSLRDTDETRRAITDNLRYRRSARDLEHVQQEVAKLEEHNAEADKSRHDREGHKWSIKRNEFAAEEATVMGTMRSKDDQLTQLIKDWETDYKGAKGKYKEALVRVETTKAAVDDLGRYSGALDKAIMRYHTLKMEEINRIVDELWRNTYQGTDVDTIMIRSDNEGMKGNKSYNYRVVMVKQDVEMDMRGRCSAGQKMLASIIIRLALAECFGVNCGLIALDEPTTNLDRDNIRSLATSLNSIIKVRQQQANFQLIIITHDEEFLDHMGCSDFADEYYRVARNERQKSIIRKQQISDVRLG